MPHDLVIRGGMVVDGTGAPASIADVAIDGDLVVEVGRVEGTGQREIDAEGRVVTPGFVDIHTHLDAQLSWDPIGSSSCWHGVTSVVLGNCGVTFAPVAPGGREFLAEMMESVEDIPAECILDGLSWNWETYGEYLAEVALLPKGVNAGGMVGHCAVRVAAMGERSLDEDPATAEDIAAMVPMVDEALAAGALGFSTSRTFLHRVPDGRYVPGTHATEDELFAFADSLGHYGGIFECAAKLGGRNDPEGEFTRDEIRMYGDISRRGDCPVTFGLTQVDIVPDMHLRVLDHVAEQNANGARIRPQTTSRQIGILFGLSGRTPFDRADGWGDLRDLSLAEKVARFTEPSSRAALVAAAEDAAVVFVPIAIESMRSGRLRRVGRGDNLIDMVYVENAADADTDGKKAAVAARPRRERVTPVAVSPTVVAGRPARKTAPMPPRPSPRRSDAVPLERPGARRREGSAKSDDHGQSGAQAYPIPELAKARSSGSACPRLMMSSWTPGSRRNGSRSSSSGSRTARPPSPTSTGALSTWSTRPSPATG